MIQKVSAQNVADAGLVYSLSWQASHKDIVDPGFLLTHTPRFQKDLLLREMEKGKEIFIDYEENIPMGIVSYDGRSGEIGTLYVHPAHWGKGCGRKLLDFAVQKAAGRAGLHLWVLNVNARARRIYEKYGFSFCGETHVLSEEKDIRELKYLYGASFQQTGRRADGARENSGEENPAMTPARRKVFDFLDGMGVPYEVTEHPAVYTIDEMDALQLEDCSGVVKNLFVREDKKKRYFIIVLQKDKKADLKALRSQLGCRPLSFASEADLQAYLGLLKGSVTPLGVLNDSACGVEVALDWDLLSLGRVGVHPNENTATVWLKPEDLEAVLRRHGNPVLHITV